jgi:hypothetical protein
VSTSGAPLTCEHVWEPPRDGRLRIIAAGRALYERDWNRYRELYPDVDARELHALVV